MRIQRTGLVTAHGLELGSAVLTRISRNKDLHMVSGTKLLYSVGASDIHQFLPIWLSFHEQRVRAPCDYYHGWFIHISHGLPKSNSTALPSFAQAQSARADRVALEHAEVMLLQCHCTVS